MNERHGVRWIDDVFLAARSSERAVLIPYLTLGYPTPEGSVALADAAIAGGADILELGIPFSDPLADGRIIQRATQGALAEGTTVRTCLELAALLRARRPEIPFLFMGYLNPILAFGEAAFCKACREAGVDGLIIPDLPPEEGGVIEELCRQEGMALVYLLAPNTPTERIRTICERSQGYVYLVSVTGTTGSRERLPDRLAEVVGRVRNLTDKPIAVGFGISTPEQASAVAHLADGVIVGSAVVQRCESETGPEDVEAFVAELRAAMRKAPERRDR
ncbi:MAG: tryptophan synthase subunit alpha [Candidatus Bipolaricaulia bacterium]